MTRKTFGTIIFVLGMLLIVWALVFVEPKSKTNNEADKPSEPSGSGLEVPRIDKIRLRLKWLHQAQFAGFYCADSLGFYREEGIEVHLEAGGQDKNAINLVAARTDDIGVWGSEQILIARNYGIPVIAIGVVYQETAACFLGRPDRGITEFKDIEGKKVGTQIGTDLETIYKALVSINRVERKKVNEENVSFDFQKFLLGLFDVWPSYITNETFYADEAKIPYKVISPSESGLHFYGDTIFCSEEYAAKNHELLKKFMRATRKGWEYALKNKARAANICTKYDKYLNENHQLYMLERSDKLIMPEGRPLFYMTEKGWLDIQEVLINQNILKKAITIAEVFTNEFIIN